MGYLFLDFHHFLLAFRRSNIEWPKKQEARITFSQVLAFVVIQLLNLPKANKKVTKN
jgi:hypothetical protein